IEKVFRDRFKDKVLVSAMMDYWQGHGNDAITRLQKLLSDPDRATLHATAKEMVKNIAQLHQLFGIGQGLLKQSTPDKAQKPLRDALDLEDKLLRDEAKTY